MPNIIHVDMDAFYASIEQRDHPALRGRAVIVGAPASMRGVVAAASYEARKYGVHSAMPSTQAEQYCPDAIFIAPNFDKYISESRKVMAILREFSPLVEPLSLDEAFLDVKGCEALFGSAENIGKSIKQKIQQQLGLIASLGIAPNKFIAKIASDLEKPNGFVVVSEENVSAFLNPLPVEKMYGIGKKTLQKVHALGIKTIGDLACHSSQKLMEQFGTFGQMLWELANGRDYRPVLAEREEKSKGMERTFTNDIESVEVLRRKILEFSEEVAFQLRSRGLRGRTISLKVRYRNFQTITRSQTLDLPTNLGPRIYSVARALLDKVPMPQPVRLLGVSVSRLEDVRGPVQLEMFHKAEADNKGELRAQVVDKVRKKYGARLLKPASLIKS